MSERSEIMENNIDDKQATPLFWIPYRPRKLTDKFFISLLPISLFSWLGIGIYGIVILDKRLFGYFWKDLLWSCKEFLIYGLVAGIIVIGSLFILNKFKENLLNFIVSFVIIVTIILAIALIAISIFWKSFYFELSKTSLFKIFYILDEHVGSSLFICSILGIVLIYNVTIFVCTRELGVATMGSLIKEPIQTIVNCVPALIFSLVMNFLLLIVIIITTIMYFYVFEMFHHIRLHFMSFELSDYLLIIAFISGNLYILNFMWNFGFMVMADYFAHYYGSQKFSRTYVSRSIGRVCRYHLGTIAFLSIPILPSIFTLIMVFKNNKEAGKESEYKLINFISKMSLIADISEYALVESSVYASNTFKSIKQMVDLHHSNPLIFLTLNTVHIKIIDLIMTISLFFGCFAVDYFRTWILHMFRGPYTYHYERIYGIPVKFLIPYVLYVMYKLIVRPATCTSTIHKMIHDQHESKTSSEQSDLTVD